MEELYFWLSNQVNHDNSFNYVLRILFVLYIFNTSFILNLFCIIKYWPRLQTVMHALQYNLVFHILLCAYKNLTCNPCAVDLRPCIKRCVSQGERSPMSTCLQCNLCGTGFTLQLGSFRMWAVSFGKSGSSPVRSSWTLRKTLNFKTWQSKEYVWTPSQYKSFYIAQYCFSS